MKHIGLSIILVALLSLTLPAKEYTTIKDAVYRDGTSRCALDISYIQGKENRPVIIWFHGGSLTGREKFTPKEFLSSDYVVVSVEYRLYPDVAVKDIIDDAAMATAWVVNNIAEYGGSSDKIYLSGHSAGAYLVSMIALDKQYLWKHNVNPDNFAAIVPLSGQMMTHFTEKRSRGIPKTQPLIDEMAPLYHIRADSAPFVVVTGGRDLEMTCRYEENALFCALMKHIGHPSVTLYEEDGFNHGKMLIPGYAILMSLIAKNEKLK